MVGDVVRLSGTNYIKAQANTEANAEAVGIIQAVADANNFTVQVGGRITGLSGLTAGSVYYLDDDTAGLLTLTEPPDVGDISKPLLIADTTTSGWIFNMRGKVVPQTAGTLLHVAVIGASSVAAGVAWTNMPAAETILYGQNYQRFGLDLSNYTQIRWSFYQNALGSAGSKLFVQFSTTLTGTYAAIDGGTGTEIDIATGSAQRKATGWLNLAAGAKADIFVRIAGSGGDAAADPGFGTMFLEFR